MAKYSSRRLAFVFAGVLAVALGTALPQARREIAEHNRRQSLEQLLVCVSARTNGQVYFTGVPLSSRAPDAASQATIAARFVDIWKDDQSPLAARGRGVVELVQGRLDAAIWKFESAATDAPRDATVWNDLAAARLQRAFAFGRSTDLPAALRAADHALRLDPDLAPARFNRAATIEGLGHRHEAARAWRSFLEVDSRSDWSAVALRRLSRLNQPTRKSLWAAVKDGLTTMSNPQIGTVTKEFPQFARRWAEVEAQSLWANAHLRRDSAGATRYLTIARLIGRTLAETSGEHLLAESVARIDAATPQEADRLARAQITYQKGRRAASQGAFTEALRSLRQSAREFADLGSPMERLCRLSQGTVLSGLQQHPESLQVLSDLQRDEADAGSRHRALLAEILWHVGLGEGLRGRWSVALDALIRASTEYERLGEHGHLGAVQSILGESYDAVGQPHEGWQMRVAASRILADDGDERRLHIAVAAGTFAAMAVQDWETARSLSFLDQATAIECQDTELIARAFLRQAVTRFHLGESAAALDALSAGRSTARQIPERNTAIRTDADLDVAEAMIRRTSAPEVALRLMDNAIEALRAVGLYLYLPQLHLERGRTHLRLGDKVAAAADFESGINLLLMQRTMIPSHELRVGIFDNSSALFDEALRLALHEGDIDRAFDVVERSRARALFDQIATGSHAFHRSTARELQALLGDATFVEFAVLPEHVVTFVITRTTMHTYEVPVTAAELDLRINAFTSLITASRPRTPVEEVRAAASTLFDALLAPAAVPAESLVIISGDGPLQRVPWAALYNAVARRYFCEDHPLLLAPSAAVFVATSASVRADRRGPPRDALLIGNPAPDEKRFPRLPSLHGSEAEVRRIEPLHAHASVWLRDAATRTRFFTKATQYDMIHFAGHSVAGLDRGEDSFLLFAPDDSGSAVYTPEVASMRFTNTRLVILAACSSSLGPARGKEGMPSIARGFLAAGVPTVAGTLWDIDDEDSQRLFTSFHRNLAAGMQTENALREAQRDLIRKAHLPSAHPNVWAGVQIMGGRAK